MAVKLARDDLKRLEDLEREMRLVVDSWDETMDSQTCAFVETSQVRDWLGELRSIRQDLETRRDDANRECPKHYLGDGFITCEDAMESMLSAAPDVKGIVARWWADALKYVWRWPLKDHPSVDLDKARSCIDRLEFFVDSNDWMRR